MTQKALHAAAYRKGTWMKIDTASFGKKIAAAASGNPKYRSTMAEIDQRSRGACERLVQARLKLAPRPFGFNHEPTIRPDPKDRYVVFLCRVVRRRRHRNTKHRGDCAANCHCRAAQGCHLDHREWPAFSNDDARTVASRGARIAARVCFAEGRETFSHGDAPL
jgi:hypothetical protein